jgi:multicomponent Na+:H+ antiporter subunit D
MDSAGQTVALALLVPTVGAVLIACAGRVPNLRETITGITSIALFACVLTLLPTVVDGARPELSLFTVMPGLQLAFNVEPLGMLFALIASGLWIVNSLYSVGYMRGNAEAHQTRFYVCFALALAATMAIAFAANLFTLFVFYELLTLVTYPLVTHHGTPEARQGGRTYLGILLGTSIVLLLPALVCIWYVAGTTDFVPGGILRGKLGDAALVGLLALCVFGFAKAALMPFHRWLPAAMVAPTPVSALLHAVAVVKAGVFSVVKVIVYVFGTEPLAAAGTGWLVGVAGFTIVAASLVALNADNLKRRLAYSTVSQLSYVVLAAALLTPLSVIGAALHIATHAVAKITLFFAAGAIYTAGHKTEVSQLDGIGRRMPWTMAAFTVAALSLIGVPPAAGFVSKWFILSSAAQGENYLVLAVLALSTLLNAAYLLPIVHAAFFKPLNAADVAHPHGEAPWPMVLALTLTAGATVALFFFSTSLLQLVRQLVAGPS